jgi:hypothetical protein
VLDFEPSDPDADSGSVEQAGADLDLEDILSSVRETAYRWDFNSDRIDWAPNAAAVLGIADFATIARGRAFALLVDPSPRSPSFTNACCA